MELIIPLVIMVAALWFMSRSQKKQQQQRKDQLDAMKVGDEIVTIGGLHGVLSEIHTDKGTVVLDCEGIYLEFDRAAIKSNKASASAVAASTPADTSDDDADEAETDEKPAEYVAPKITRPDDDK